MFGTVSRHSPAGNTDKVKLNLNHEQICTDVREKFSCNCTMSFIWPKVIPKYSIRDVIS